MPLEVVGAGFGRTGTLSLKQALERLGLARCYHMVEVLEHPAHIPQWAAAHRGVAVDWDALLAGYRAAVDWPSCNLWRELAQHYPQAKIILTTRDPGSWYESVMSTIYPISTARRTSEDPAARAFGEWINEIVWEGVFDGRIHDRAHAMRVFESHRDAVIREVPAGRLLVLEGEQSWETLCGFLDRPVPDEPYPRVNSRADFLAGGGAAGAARRG